MRERLLISVSNYYSFHMRTNTSFIYGRTTALKMNDYCLSFATIVSLSLLPEL